MTIQVKRAYEAANDQDGKRILVDRLWPRGIRKEDLHLDDWLKEVAPSNELRRWFHQNPDNWDDFLVSYYRELDVKPDVWQPILEAVRLGKVTLIFSNRNTERNNAVALKDYIERKSVD